MDVIKAQYERMRQQLGALTASQRMLAAALVAVMVLTLALWSRYAGTAEMEPVLAQSLKADELSRITLELRKQGIEYRVVNDQVLVAADRRMEALANLSYAQAVPRDTRNSYDEIVKRISPWDSAANAEATRIEAKNAFLSQVIRNFPNIASADVMIDPTSQRLIGGGGKQPTAMVQITTRDGVNGDKQLARAAAYTVSGAQSGLAASRVTVVINGVTHRVPDIDDPAAFSGADDMLSAQQQAERALSQKVLEQLSFISGVLVTVTVDIDIQSQSKSEELYDPKNVVKAESQVDQTNSEETNNANSAAEPGAQTNVGVTLGAQPAATGGTSSTKEQTITKFDNRFSKSNVQTNTPAGKARALRAAVRVPRSFLVQQYRQSRRAPVQPVGGGSAAPDEPDDETLKPILIAEAKGIRDDVRGCTGIVNDADISVESYPDAMPMMLAASIRSKSPGSDITALLSGHYKELGIGLLALISLFMVSGMVKKGSPAPAIAPPMELKEAPILVAEEDVAGEASEGNRTLDGMELDEDAVRAQTMVDQVSTMVKENPDSAAQLVKRWLNRT